MSETDSERAARLATIEAAKDVALLRVTVGQIERLQAHLRIARRNAKSPLVQTVYEQLLVHIDLVSRATLLEKALAACCYAEDVVAIARENGIG